MNKAFIGVIVLFFALFLGACTQQNSVTPSLAPVEEGDQIERMNVGDDLPSREVAVEAFNYGFTPSTIEVTKGEKVKLVVNNKGGFHDFVAKDLDINAQLDVIKPTEIEFTADKVGSFEFICSVGDHASQGMKGTIVVK